MTIYDFWGSICQMLERRHPTFKFRWDLDITNTKVQFLIESSDGDYLLLYFNNDTSYDTDSTDAIVNHISHIIFDKFKED